MADLKTSLVALMRGQGSVEAVDEALKRLLAKSPDKAPLVGQMFDKARAAGLAEHLHTALKHKLDLYATQVEEYPQTIVLKRAPPAPTPPVDEAPDPQATVPAAAEPPDPDATTLAADEVTATQESPDPDATVLATEGGDVTAAQLPLGTEDATEVAATGRGEDATDINAAAAHKDAAEIAGVDEDATEISAVTHEDATEGTVRDEADDDATRVAGSAEDATTVNVAGTAEEDATAVNVPGRSQGTTVTEDAFDILAPDAITAAESAVGGAGIDREFREGDLLRGRFELISKLGEGGMGAVWKGLDKLKEEARDRNPYVAIKLLQGDFKEHPEAFIALQRETSKQQRLAHPNIATVHDFDRDDATNTVFMTMEVLEGQPLDVFVRKLPQEGLAEEEAMPLLEQLCNGLAYAHSHGLVHSDLKPGNCFYTKDGVIKLLDFGIARASKTKADEEGETTVFDPGKLGALTPTYATIEMFDGQDPDPRDDIYALAIMAYQLFTSKHPYGKKSAPKAKEIGLSPDPIDKLDKRQNKAMARGLAFHRDDRSPSVEEFLDGLTKKKSRAPLYALAASLLLVVIGALSFNPIMNVVKERERERIVAVMQRGGIDDIRDGLAQASALGDPEQLSLILEDGRTKVAIVGHFERGDEQSIEEAGQAIAGFDDRWQREVREAAQGPIFDLYESKANGAFAPGEGRYDFPAAWAAIGALDKLYEDSARVLQLKNQFTDEKENTLGELGGQYNELRDGGALIPTEGEADVGDVLAIIRQIQADHRLLNDEQLKFKFAEQAERAMGEEDYGRANAYLVASVAYAPDDPKLNDLRFQVTTELERIENEKRVAEIQQRLEQELARLESLADFRQVRDDLIELADLSPTNPVLNRIQSNLKTAFSSALDRDVEAKQWEDAEGLLVAYAKLLEVPYLTEKRALLSSAERVAGFELASSSERKNEVDARVKEVEALLAAPAFTSDWEIRLKGPYKELIALLPSGDPLLAPVRERTAQLYLDRSAQARKAGIFAAALAFVDKGRIFYPDLDKFDAEVSDIELAKLEAERVRKEEERKTRIASLMKEFEEKAGRNDIAGAREELARLQAEKLDADDTFLAEQAPAVLAAAYLRTAAKAAEGNAYDNALTLAQAGLALAPAHEELATAVSAYTEEVAKRQVVSELSRLFDSLDEIDAAATTAAMDKTKADFPDEYADHRSRWAESRAHRIRTYANDKVMKIPTLSARTGEFDQVFPGNKGALRDEVAGLVEKRIRGAKLDSADAVTALENTMAAFKTLSSARHKALTQSLGEKLAKDVRALEGVDKLQAAALLAAARTTLPGASALDAIDIELPLAQLVDGGALMKKGRLTAAKTKLEDAKSSNPNHSDIAGFERALESAMAKALSGYDKYKAAAAKAKTKDQKKLDNAFAAIEKQWSDNDALKRIKVVPTRKGQCLNELAGHGAKRAGVCYDVVAKKKGPTLVVVPAGNGLERPFAIGKFEVTIADYNLFCKRSKQCKAVKGKSKLPVTGIGIQQAEAYAKWLSEEASKTEKKKVVYRLPTEAEWLHAARASGAPAEKKFNCRVESGGSVIAGHALMTATGGTQNGWGLAHYIGNAQEWVRAGGGVAARGGAFEDPLAKCDIELTRSHSGAADGITGFRLVRELG